jgi:hypothetical protein
MLRYFFLSKLSGILVPISKPSRHLLALIVSTANQMALIRLSDLEYGKLEKWVLRGIFKKPL